MSNEHADLTYFEQQVLKELSRIGTVIGTLSEQVEAIHEGSTTVDFDTTELCDAIKEGAQTIYSGILEK